CIRIDLLTVVQTFALPICYFVLYLEHVGRRSIENLRPDVITTTASDQLRADAQISAALAYAAFENVPDLELPADVGHVEIFASKIGRASCRERVYFSFGVL